MSFKSSLLDFLIMTFSKICKALDFSLYINENNLKVYFTENFNKIITSGKLQ